MTSIEGSGECLDDNDALRILLKPHDDDATAAREHLDQCESCRALVAAGARALGEGEPTAPGWPSTELAKGSEIGAYRILHVLGRGAMGTVYLAWDDRLARRVAVKVLDREVASDRAWSRLRTEARAMAQLRHPNVVEVLDFGKGVAGPFIAMEYVDGTDFHQWLRERPRPVSTILDHLLQAGRGLAAAHRSGMVHRDFKPANILVGRDGRVKVADFGLARLRPGLETIRRPRSPSPTGAVPTESSREMMAGTPAYMAPEQFDSPSVEPRADQFAFCVTAFEALAGHRPFESQGVVERLHAIAVQGPGRRPARMPRAWYLALRRGLQAEPEQRHANMDALLRVLAPRPRRSWIGMLAVGVAALGLGVAAGQPWGTQPPCAQQPAPLWTSASGVELRGGWASRGHSKTDIVRLIHGLDAQARDLAEARASICAPQREPADDQLDRLACLGRLERELDQFVTDAFAATAAESEGFIRVASRPTPTTRCTNPDSPPTEDATVVALTSELRIAYRSADARGATDELAQLRPRLVSAIDQASAGSAHGARAELTHMRASLDRTAGDHSAAERGFESAFDDAHEVGNSALAFDAALDRSHLAAHLGRPQTAWRWLRHAQSTAQSLEASVARTIRLATREGDLHREASHLDAAAQAFDVAGTGWEAQVPATVAVQFHSSRGHLLELRADFEACRAAYMQGVQQAQSRMGPRHPELLRPLIGAALCEIRLRRGADALQHLQLAADIADSVGDPVAEATARGNLGLLHRNEGRPTRGLEQLRRADALMRQRLPDHHVELAVSTTNLADAYAEVGRWEDARIAARRAKALWSHNDIEDGVGPYVCALTLAWARIMDRDPSVVGTIQALVRDAPNDDYRTRARIGLLRALVQQGDDARAVVEGRSLFADSERIFSAAAAAEGLSLYGHALAREGQHDDAREQLTQALELAESLSDDPRGLEREIRLRVDAALSSTLAPASD